jgi:hypothetical protein
MNDTERNKKAYELLKLNEIEKAIELYELNVQLKTQNLATYNRLISIYRKANDKENMNRILKLLLVIHEEKLRVLEKAPQNNRYLFNYEKQRLIVDFVRTSIDKK